MLHSDPQLEAILGQRILSRETIHQWPLSRVQALVCEDGTRYAYKAQIPPTVENEFYQCARSPILPEHIDTGVLEGTQTLLLAWIADPRLDQLAMDVTVAHKVAIGRRVVASIGGIQGDLPFYLDLGSRSKWRNFCEKVQHDLKHLVAIERLQHVTANGLAAFERCFNDAAILASIDQDSQMIHGDLMASQIYWTEDHHFVIDWQRPIIAPAQVDLATLLINLQIDPSAYVSKAAIQVHWILLLHWAVFAQGELFPEQRWPVFDEWVSRALTNLQTLDQ